jgi:anion-transporting  ArsA/GET3 family ATPase
MSAGTPYEVDVVEELARHDVIICCGAGGVGKTTVSAALGMAIAATRTSRVLVLTIDPARRLATALGLKGIGTVPVVIAPDQLRSAGLEPHGEMAAAMLDMKSEWDRLIERYAPNSQVRNRIFDSPFYKGISEAFIGSHEYMALEALYRFHSGGEYDCIVVDTPPSRSALDFLEAPMRITDFVGVRLLAWLAGPARVGWRALNFTTAPFLRLADRLLGGEVLQELAAFVRDIETLYGGVQQRAEAVSRLLRSRSTAFAVVTTLEAAPFAEAEFFCSKLRQYSMPLRALVVNRVLPDALRDRGSVRAATTLIEDPGIASWMEGELGQPVAAETPHRLGEAFLALNRVAEANSAQMMRLARFGRIPIARLPLADRDVSDLTALGHLARWLRGSPE